MRGSKYYDVNLWVATSPCGGFGGPPPRKCRNMKCSRSDSRPTGIIGLYVTFGVYIWVSRPYGDVCASLCVTLRCVTLT